MKVSLTGLLCILDALGHNLLCLFYKLTVQINGIAIDAADSIVLAEDVIGGLFVVVVCFGGVLLGLGRHFVSGGTIAPLVSLACLCSKVLMLRLLFTREVTKTIILGFRAGGLGVVEGYW